MAFDEHKLKAFGWLNDLQAAAWGEVGSGTESFEMAELWLLKQGLVHVGSQARLCKGALQVMGYSLAGS
ncbi:hypothetical protein TUM17384_31520 [Shewanella algae]|nr:hypothetical protein AYJ02_19805 [Shewanella algae]BCV59207.1 hypothetical protein TUM17384_31520 [Shewanella algae]